VLAALAEATGDDAVSALAVSPREPMSMRLVAPALAEAMWTREFEAAGLRYTPARLTISAGPRGRSRRRTGRTARPSSASIG
jgi:hypothetical protein